MKKSEICQKSEKSHACDLFLFFLYILSDPLSSIIGRCTLYTPGYLPQVYIVGHSVSIILDRSSYLPTTTDNKPTTTVNDPDQPTTSVV